MRNWALLLILFAIPLVAQTVDSLQIQALEDSIQTLNHRITRIEDRWPYIEKAADKPAEWLKWFVGILLGLASAAVIGSVTFGIYNIIRVERDVREIKKLKKQAQADCEEIRRMKEKVNKDEGRIDILEHQRSPEIRKGLNLLSEGEYEEALKVFEEVLEKVPKEDLDEAKTYNLIGATYAKQKDYNKAVKAYQKAIALDDSYAVFFLNLGLALRAQRKYPESKEAFEKALERQPVYPQVNYHLALVLTALGEKDKALDHLSIWSHANIPPPKSKLWEEPRLKPLQEGKYRARFIEIVGPPPEGKEK